MSKELRHSLRRSRGSFPLSTSTFLKWDFEQIADGLERTYL